MHRPKLALDALNLIAQAIDAQGPDSPTIEISRTAVLAVLAALAPPPGEDLHLCPHCQSSDLEEEVWAYTNDGWPSGDTAGSEAYCNGCQEHIRFSDLI